MSAWRETSSKSLSGELRGARCLPPLLILLPRGRRRRRGAPRLARSPPRLGRSRAGRAAPIRGVAGHAERLHGLVGRRRRGRRRGRVEGRLIVAGRAQRLRGCLRRQRASLVGRAATCCSSSSRIDGSGPASGRARRRPATWAWRALWAAARTSAGRAAAAGSRPRFLRMASTSFWGLGAGFGQDRFDGRRIVGLASPRPSDCGRRAPSGRQLQTNDSTRPGGGSSACAAAPAAPSVRSALFGGRGSPGWSPLLASVFRSASRPHPRPPARAAPRRAGRPTTRDWSASSTCMGSTTTPCRRRRRARGARPREYAAGRTSTTPIKSTWAAPGDSSRRVVAALHQGEGSPNYGMIFKQLDAAPRRIQRHNLKSGSGLLRPPPRDRHIDLLFDALDSDDSNEVANPKGVRAVRAVTELPADFPKPKPKLTVVKRPQSAPAVRRRIRTLSIQQSGAAAPRRRERRPSSCCKPCTAPSPPRTRSCASGIRHETRDRLVSRLGCRRTSLTPARLWHKIAKFAW